MERIKRHIARVGTFDLMRGYFMVAIIIDHIAFFPNGLDWWSARGGLFVTAAEGFFLISGLVLGIVRGAKLIEKPFGMVVKILLKRGLQLYGTLVVSVLLFTFLGWIFYDQPGLKEGILPPDTNIFTVIISALGLQYYYGWADYLRLYALFLFAAPLAFYLLRRGMWYVVLAISFVVWLLYPAEIQPFAAREYFQPLSWQLLFFGGVVMGFHWNHLLDAWRSLGKRTEKVIIISVLSLAGITVLINIGIMLSTMGFNMGPLTPQLQHDLYTAYFDKERLPITRIIMALLWFWASFYLFKKYEKSITKVFGWLLVPFGTNSLYVYTLHAFAIFFIHLCFTASSWWWNFLVTAGAILLIRLAVHYKFLMKIIPR